MPNATGPAGQHGTQSCLPRWTTTLITLCGACSALDSVHSCAAYYQMVPEPNHRTPVLRANWMSLLLTIKWGETLPHMRRWCQWHESTWLFRLTGVQVEEETHKDTFCSISFLSWLDESYIRVREAKGQDWRPCCCVNATVHRFHWREKHGISCFPPFAIIGFQTTQLTNLTFDVQHSPYKSSLSGGLCRWKEKMR